MKKLLSLATVALVALAMGVSAKAEPATPYVHSLERKIAWQEQHIRQLKHRRDHLHRYIKHLRKRYHAPSSPSTSTTSYPSGVLSASQVAAYARGAGFPESVISTMVAIAYRESRFNPGAINSSSGACGLWQIYPAQPGCTNPAANAAMAYAKYHYAATHPPYNGLAPWSL